MLSGGAAALAVVVSTVKTDGSDDYGRLLASLSARNKKTAVDDRGDQPTAFPSELPVSDDARVPPLYDTLTLIPPVPVAVHNAAIVVPAGRSALKAAGLWDGNGDGAPLPELGAMTEDDAEYTLKSLRPGLTYVCTRDDAIEMTHAIGVVAITRGCHPAVAAAVHANLAAAAKADTEGFLWYVVSDSTPDSVVDALEQRLGISVDASFYETHGAWPPVGGASSAGGATVDEGALPTLLLTDRYKATFRKYVMPLPQAEPTTATASVPSAATVAGASTQSSPQLPEQVRFLLSAAVPQPSAIASWAAKFPSGGLVPTLLGDVRPTGDVHPIFPFLGVATSKSFADVVLDPRHDVALEAYLSDCPMCMALGARVRMAAFAAQSFFPFVRVATMNVDTNERPRGWLPGPAFPTIQLFNGGSGGSAKGFTKMHGPGCSHLHAPAGAEAPSTAAGVASSSGSGAEPAPTAAASGRPYRHVGNAKSGSPPCVPALDFSHPTSPGRMALPSVTELVAWIGANASIPFAPEAVRVPASAVRHAARRFPDLAESIGVSPLPESASGTVSLSALCDDMEVEARLFETGVFQTLWFGSVAEQYAKTFGVGGAAAPESSSSADSSTRAQAQRAERLAGFQRLLADTKAVVVDGGMYGAGEGAEAALDACDAYLADSGLLRELRARMRDEAEAETEVEALQAAASLVGPAGAR